MSRHAPVHRLDEPTGNTPRHSCVPAERASVSPGKIILAPKRPAVSQHPVGPLPELPNRPMIWPVATRSPTLTVTEPVCMCIMTLYSELPWSMITQFPA
jgi:hypothetical protein